MESLAHPSATSQPSPAEQFYAAWELDPSAAWQATWRTVWSSLSFYGRRSSLAVIVQRWLDWRGGIATPEVTAALDGPTGPALQRMMMQMAEDVARERACLASTMAAEATARLVAMQVAPAAKKGPIVVSEIVSARARRVLEERGYVVSRRRSR